MHVPLSLMIAMLSLSFSAHPPSCSIHPPKGSEGPALLALSRITEPQAYKAALAALRKYRNRKVLTTQLKTESECLIWSYDVDVGDPKALRNVHIDAGTGQVLSVESKAKSQQPSNTSNPSAPSSPPATPAHPAAE
jgi:hypothetical protein